MLQTRTETSDRNNLCLNWVLCCFLLFAEQLPAEELELPEPIVWTDSVALSEISLSYTPVSGSIVKAVMYGSGTALENSAFVLLPTGLKHAERLCLQVDTLDGSYIGTGQIVGEIQPNKQLTFKLHGKEFDRQQKYKVNSVLKSWITSKTVCNSDQPKSLVPTSWEAPTSPVYMHFYINSSGKYSRIAFEAPTGNFQVVDCDAINGDYTVRVYDAKCTVRLCALSDVDRIFVEIRSRNQRVYLEELLVDDLSSYCLD